MYETEFKRRYPKSKRGPSMRLGSSTLGELLSTTASITQVLDGAASSMIGRSKTSAAPIVDRLRDDDPESFALLLEKFHIFVVCKAYVYQHVPEDYMHIWLHTHKHMD
ncbi:hypothetical protein MUCCIDRAFT_113546 [Mucor lusitanicus CBS 277.49]|uniref:Uncharacterized protein n=1 Tax=Mucor lusitanicus CBS 277.49 TaxID=747725 RepID=A0A168ILQ7_MUCCL|nr:hypothetical protein MUCCIDRAFT_113546 [Mucor lusitanicus CBS 277.49]